MTNGTSSNFQGSGSSFTVDITPSDEGDVIVNVAASVFTANSTNNEAASFTYNFVKPKAEIITVAVEPGGESSAATVDFEIHFEAVPAIAPAFSCTGATVSDITQMSDSTTAWTFTVTPNSSFYGDITVDLSTLAKKKAILAETFNFRHVIETKMMDRELIAYPQSRFIVDLTEQQGNSIVFLLPTVAGLCGQVNWAGASKKGTVQVTQASLESIKLNKAIWAPMTATAVSSTNIETFGDDNKTPTAFKFVNSNTTDADKYDAQFVACGN